MFAWHRARNPTQRLNGRHRFNVQAERDAEACVSDGANSPPHIESPPFTTPAKLQNTTAKGSQPGPSASLPCSSASLPGPSASQADTPPHITSPQEAPPSSSSARSESSSADASLHVTPRTATLALLTMEPQQRAYTEPKKRRSQARTFDLTDDFA